MSLVEVLGVALTTPRCIKSWHPAAWLLASLVSPVSSKGINAANGLIIANSKELATLMPIGFFSKDTTGFAKLPLMCKGERKVRGLKSLGMTIARKLSSSSAIDGEPSTHTVDSFVSSTMTCGRNTQLTATN